MSNPPSPPPFEPAPAGPPRGPDDLPNDLPPVQPPSVSLIVQLFVTPAIIVMAVVAVWVLFGRIAAGDQDWRRLVQELGSGNPHAKSRAMFGLSQMLEQDRLLGERGQGLSRSAELASALSGQLAKELAGSASSPEAISAQVYLARTLGMFDPVEGIWPPLEQATASQFDLEVRKSAVASMCYLMERQSQLDSAWDGRQPLDELLAFSEDADSSLRRVGAFALGLCPAPEAAQRLEVLLQDSDFLTAANAAVGLARRNSTAGLPVFLRVLTQTDEANETNDDLVTRQTTLRNVIKAVGQLGPRWSEEQRAELIKPLDQVATKHVSPRIRVDAQSALMAIQSKS